MKIENPGSESEEIEKNESPESESERNEFGKGELEEITLEGDGVKKIESSIEAKQEVNESLRGMLKDCALGFAKKASIFGVEHPNVLKWVTMGAMVAGIMIARTLDATDLMNLDLLSGAFAGDGAMMDIPVEATSATEGVAGAAEEAIFSEDRAYERVAVFADGTELYQITPEYLAYLEEIVDENTGLATEI